MPSVCQARSGSPLLGSSILITSAPKSASWRLTMFPDTSRDMSMTRTPSSGHAAPGSKDFSAMVIGTAPLRLLGGRRGYRTARGDWCRADAAEIYFRHRQIELLQHRIGQPVVVSEVAPQPAAPVGHAAAGVVLEGRFARVESGRDMVPGHLQQGRALQRGVPAAAERLLEPIGHFGGGKISVGRGNDERGAGQDPGSR